NKVGELGLNQHSWNSSNIFSNSGDLSNLMGVMLSIPEIKSSLDKLVGGKDSLTGSKLAELTNDWVAGKDIELISTQYFGGADEEQITKCCRAIYSTLINSATWGLSSIQKIPNSGLNFENMSDDEVRRINNLPAMIYYGVNTDEAILMRMNNIPRGIADNLGKRYKKQSENIYNVTNNEVSKWLKELSESEWEQVSRKAKDISGKEYKKVWRILNGEL
ncbi:MAG: DEAD/DEAH box helicase, partial [Eubacteriales bacterium]